MLTPQDINGKEFEKAVFGGYDMSSVDEFLESVSNDYGALYKENAILKGKIKVLVEKVEEYRSTEDSMRMALLTAQKMGDEMVDTAKEKSREMLENAEREVKQKLQESDKKLRDENARLTAAKRETAVFVEKAKDAIRKYAGFLGRLDEITDIKEEKPAPPPPTREEEIVDTARAIDSAVTKLVQDEPGHVTPTPAPASAVRSVPPIAQQVAAQQAKNKQQTQTGAPPVPERPSGRPRTVIRAPEAQTPSFDLPEESRENDEIDTASIQEAVAHAIKQENIGAAAMSAPQAHASTEGVHKDENKQAAQPVKYDDEAEPTKLFRMKTPASDWDDEDEPTSPRPKFSFDNLRFGSNYKGSDQ